jgi:hypothetical protein
MLMSELYVLCEGGPLAECNATLVAYKWPHFLMHGSPVAVEVGLLVKSEAAKIAHVRTFL